MSHSAILWCCVTGAFGDQPIASAAPSASVAKALDSRCRTRRGLAMLLSPLAPQSARALRVMVVSERPQKGATLIGKGPEGLLTLKVTSRGAPPYWWFAEVPSASVGRYHFVLADSSGGVLACGRRRVRRRVTKAPSPPDAQAWWTSRGSWTRARENLYAAWIEKLFDAPKGTRPTWSPLHAVLRDAKRNFLFNHLGASEDDPIKGVVVKPDCADLPYFLRAYFAWKLRLPFGYRQCSRGSARRAPRCGPLKTNAEALPPSISAASPAERFSYFLRRRVSYVHSGAGNTAAIDSETDFYPLRLSRNAIRPGTAYIDPAGHLMVIARWFPQEGGRSGQLLVIESQPDLTIGRKRFWRGAMMFTARPRGAAGGFKAFRPLALRDGAIAALPNDELRSGADYRRTYSAEQYRLSKDAFYDRVDRLINPEPLSPKAAFSEQIAALHELIQKRRDSVATGEAFVKQSGEKVIAMPDGPRIFQTSGPWEDYSTPARDFRLLIAIDEVLGFPARVTKHPERFSLAEGKKPAAVARELQALLAQQAKKRTIDYLRSDGSSWTLTMAQVIARRKGLEMAYNPNDCIERRWMASGAELSTCRRHAPTEQRKRMEGYRSWFANRTRPSSP